MASTTGKVIVVTGSNSGFGHLTVKTLAANGHTVFATMRNTRSKNKTAAEDLRAWSKEHKYAVHVLELDVTNDDSVSRAITEVIDATGRIDVLVNNAGVVQAGVTEAFTVEQARKLFEVNVFGVLRVNKAVLPTMRKQGNGLLVHISSGIGRLPMAFLGIYSASKFALEGLAESTRYELAPLGIDSVIVEPGAYPTGILDKTWMPEDEETLASYGELAKGPEKMFAGIAALFASKNPPNLQDVADAVKTLVDRPYGQRPIRTVVDSFTGKFVESLNTCSDDSMTKMMKAYGN